MAKRAKRVPKPRLPLSRERALDLAVELADKAGLAELSMRQLAKALGVEAMSLYHHVKNKDDILNGMVDRVFAEIALPEIGAGWREQMKRRSHSARAALKRHPWALALMESRAAPGPATLKHHDATLGCLRAAGFSIALTAHAYSALDGYTYGFALTEQSLPFQSPGETEQVAASMMGAFPAGAYPHLVELATTHVLKPGYSYGDEFAWGLELVLDGLERARAEEAPR
jgi:AcrR family transcriptional regulator